ncbi:interferon-induced protein 44, partial [Biomphalaria pfeifferi]
MDYLNRWRRNRKLLTSWTSNSVALLSQQHVNDLIMNFVIGDMQAFSVVESPEFIKLLTGLQPGKTVMTRKTITGNIEDEYKTMHDDLQQMLSLVTGVCKTA